MFHSPSNPLIRVAVFPVLLLFWQYIFGTDLPLLAPAMCAVFLTTTHNPPPLIMVVLMTLVLYITAWVQALMSHLFGDFPQVYYLALFGMFYWCMDRTKRNPQDLLAILLIVSTAMIAVFTKQKEVDVSNIPGALFVNMLVAGFVAYVAYFLFPGGEPLAEQIQADDPTRPIESTTQTFLKASLIMITLLVAIQLNLEQSTIISVVVGLIIKDPKSGIGADYGIRRLLTTYGSVLYAIPPLVLSIFQANMIAIIGSTVVCSLFMGIAVVEKKASYNSIQLLYSSYVVLIFYGITSSGISGLPEDLVRFASILSAVIIGVMGLIVLQPKPRSSNKKGIAA